MAKSRVGRTWTKRAGQQVLNTSLRMHLEGSRRSARARARALEAAGRRPRMRPRLAGVLPEAGLARVADRPAGPDQEGASALVQGVRGSPGAAESGLRPCFSGTEALGWTGVALRSGSRRRLPGRGPAHPRTILFGVGHLGPAQTQPVVTPDNVD